MNIFSLILDSRKNNQKGFTVVELMITIGICGVIVPALAVGLNSLTVINNRARDLALVNIIAQNKVEILRSSGYNSLSNGTTDFTSELPTTIASPKSATYIISSPATGVKDVSIKVSYSEYGKTLTIDYETLISEIGVGQ